MKQSMRESRKRSVRILSGALLVVIPLFGCGLWDNDGEKKYAPQDCQRDKPHTGFLTVRVTINGENPQVPVVIYRGDIEENIVEAQETITRSETHVELGVDHRYTALARYLAAGDTVYATDAASLDSHSDEYVDATCWYVGRAEVDVRLSGR